MGRVKRGLIVQVRGIVLALLLKVDSDAGEGARTQGVYDKLLVALQFIYPVVAVYFFTRKGVARVQRAMTKGESSNDGAPDPLSCKRRTWDSRHMTMHNAAKHNLGVVWHMCDKDDCDYKAKRKYALCA